MTIGAALSEGLQVTIVGLGYRVLAVLVILMFVFMGYENTILQ